MANDNQTGLTIDLDHVVATKFKGKKVPKSLVRFLKRFIHQDWINDCMSRCRDGEYFYAAGLLLFCLVVVIVLTLLRRQVVRLMHRIGQKILGWLRKADLPNTDPEIPPLQDDLP